MARVITLIAALDRNRAIGRAGAMPWHLSDDLKRFKALTLGRPVLMGRKTALAIGRPLPGRPNLVLTRGVDAPFDGQVVVHSLGEAIDRADGQELCVIGGGEVYALALPRATRMHLTEIDTATPGADTFFPEYDPREWREVAREHHPIDARHPLAFDFVEYERIGEVAVGTPLPVGEGQG
ncbi:MAG TPA: dihydrofolate reductase [Rhodanobacteraceae bacterium]|nr:dihydrofolate reductase [Rhodanobacteraceae bacterium]